MGEMRERVAKALWLANGERAQPEDYLPDADAVLAAMREPTREMLDAVMAQHEGISPVHMIELRETKASIWRWMIDAAKVETRPRMSVVK